MPGQPPLLLLGRAAGEDRRSGPTDADRVVGPRDAGPLQLLVDDELVVGIGAEAPRRRPVRRDQAGAGQLRAVGCRVGVDPVPQLRSTRVVAGAAPRRHS